MLKKCGFCGNEYVSQKDHSRYCSRTCGRKAEYYRHRERYILNAKLWYTENRDRARENARQNYLENIDERRQYTRDYWNARKEEKRQKDRIYKDKIRHNGKRTELIETMGLKCSMCNKTGNEFGIVTHHLISNNHSFQIMLCRSCHARLHMISRYHSNQRAETT